MKAHVLTDPAPAPRSLPPDFSRRSSRSDARGTRGIRCARSRDISRSIIPRCRNCCVVADDSRRAPSSASASASRLSPEMITQFMELERAPAESWMSRELRQLSRDAALSLAEWHHHAILELTRLTSFKPDVRWISRVLDVPVDDVNVADHTPGATRPARHALAHVVGGCRRQRGGAGSMGCRSAPSVRSRAARARSSRSQRQINPRTTARRRSPYRPRPVASHCRSRRAIPPRDEPSCSSASAGDRDQVYCLEMAFFPVADLTPTES